jgi:hypothetical protein
MDSKEEFETAVLIKNVSDKKTVLNYGHLFLTSKGYGKQYRLQNSKTEVNFIVHNSKIAYELMKHFEEGKKEEAYLKDIEVQLTMIPAGSSSETLNNTISTNASHSSKKGKEKEKKISASFKAAMKLDEEYRNIPYFIRHTKDLRDKAGVINVINMDSPYISIEEKKRLEEKESRKKDISDKKFSSIIPKPKFKKDEGLDLTPIGNTEGFKFRTENKDKWINKRGFQVY